MCYLHSRLVFVCAVVALLFAVPRTAISQQYSLPDEQQQVPGANMVELNGDGNGNTFEEMDEGFGAGRGSGAGPDESTTAWTQEDPGTSQNVSVNTPGVTDPSSSSNHIHRVRARKDTGGGRQVDMDFRFCDVGCTLADCHGAEQTVELGPDNNDWTTYSYTLSAAEADSITGAEYSAGFCSRLTFREVGGGGPRDAQWSTEEFEVPSAGGGGSQLYVITASDD